MVCITPRFCTFEAMKTNPALAIALLLCSCARTEEPRSDELRRTVDSLRAVVESHKPGLSTLMLAMKARLDGAEEAIARGNTAYARHHVHELEEALEHVAEVYPTHPELSDSTIVLMRRFPLPALDSLERTLEADPPNSAEALRRVDNIRSACMACHRAHEHGFIDLLPVTPRTP